MLRRHPFQVFLSFIVIAGCKKPESANWVRNGFFDPTQVGRFRAQKTTEIRSELSLLEEPMHMQMMGQAEPPTADDLVPKYEEDKIAADDILNISIFELINPEEMTTQRIPVGKGGFITLPVLGRVRVAGLSRRELELEIRDQLRAKAILADADVQVTVVETARQRFSILGHVQRPGTYRIPTPEYRLLNALAEAGLMPEHVHDIFVVRKGAALMRTTPEETSKQHHHHMSAGRTPKANLSDNSLARTKGAAAPSQHSATDTPSQTGHLVESYTTRTSDSRTAQRLSTSARSPHEIEPPVTPPTTMPEKPEAHVIEIDAEELLNGDPRQNVVIRSLDLIYVSEGMMGHYYMTGNIARAGEYKIEGHPPTIMQAIASAGGFGPLAWPSRAEIIRRISDSEEQMVQVDLDAIFAGDALDVFIRPNDTVNVGSSAVSPFLAVFRNAFRLSYGFGFVYDRNFADSDSAQAREQAKTRRLQKAQMRGLPIR